MATGFLVAAFAATGSALILAYALAGFGAGWVFPAISAIAANAVNDSEQGRAAGSVSTALGLGAMLGPAVGRVLYGLGSEFPLLLGAALATVPIGVAIFARSRPRSR